MTDDLHIAVVVTCHNRREHTLTALRGLLEEQEPSAARLTVHLVDDGSTDGTGDAVEASFGDRVEVVRGPGTLFWNGGMRLAWRHARAHGPDAYLWLNDDVVLRPDALRRTLEVRTELAERGIVDPILVGSTDDPETGELTYGGVVRSAPLTRPLAFEMVQPGSAPIEVETMNGQWVLIPARVAEMVGNLDHRYGHALGDYDYGLRAGRKGVEVFVLPGMVGSCPRNPEVVPGSKPLGDEIRALTGFRQLPLEDWRVFARRWAGPLWPIYWTSPYVRRGAALLRSRLA